MPRVKQRARRADADVLQRLREAIATGEPWDTSNGAKPHGFWEIVGLVSGHFYDFGLKYCDADDEEGQRELWLRLRRPILSEHIRRRPGTRPWAWWKWEAPEMRRTVGLDCADPDHDDDCDGSHGCNGEDDGRLPAFEDPDLPAHWKKNYFGTPNAYDGFRYETEADYLDRLGLLTKAERRALRAGYCSKSSEV